MVSTCNNKKTMTAQEQSEANVGSSDQIHFSESHSLRTYHARKPCKAQPAEKCRYNARPPACRGMERITDRIFVVPIVDQRHQITKHHSSPLSSGYHGADLSSARQ